MNAFDRSYERKEAVQRSAELLRDMRTASFQRMEKSAYRRHGRNHECNHAIQNRVRTLKDGDAE